LTGVGVVALLWVAIADFGSFQNLFPGAF
jgi:hypothetical protein